MGILDSLGTLEKLRIDAYEKPDYSGVAFGTFEAYVNPTDITFGYEVEYNNSQGSGTTNSPMHFNHQKPADLTISLFLDGTGANGKVINVQDEIAKFQEITRYNGDLHRPNYLIVVWGTLPVTKCVLKSASISYKLFQANGVPLRAVIAATFTENSDDQTRVATAGDQSPDLTHVRVMKAGDTLPALCYGIYGNPAYYLDVARANGIDNFRNILPGTRIFFPPLEK